MKTNKLLMKAIEYLQVYKFSVIPINPRNKRPLLSSWKRYQKNHPTVEELNRWWTKWPNANIGVVTGKISGIIVFDTDKPEAVEYLKKHGGIPPTWQAKTKKGYHFYFRYPSDEIDENEELRGVRLHDVGLDVQSDGRYVIAPPSVHPTGALYEWDKYLNPREGELESLNQQHLDIITENRTPKAQEWKSKRKGGAEDGTRNETLYKLISSRIGQGRDEDFDDSLNWAIGWNTTGKPPMSQEEVERTVQSAWSKHLSNHPEDNLPETRDVQTELVFPEVMSGLAGRFAELYSEYLEVPKHFLYIGFLVCLGVMLSGKVTIKSEIRPQPRMYVLLLGESADMRKSTALEKTEEFFKEVTRGDFPISHGVGSAEGLQQRLLGDNDNNDDIKPLLLYLDEFRSFVGKCRIDASVLLDCVTTLFESNNYSNATKKRNVQLSNAHLGLLAASTFETYEKVWSSQFTAIGFDNRLFLVPGDARKEFSIPQEVKSSEVDVLIRDVRTAIQGVNDVYRELDGIERLTVNDDAFKVYDDWYLNKLPRSIYAKRIDGYALRLMILLAVNDNKSTIDLETVEKAINIANWQIQVRKTHAPIDADNKVAKMEEKIRRALRTHGPLLPGRLKQLTNANRDGLWVFETAINNLKRAKEVFFSSKHGKYYMPQEEI